jgi:hypothetical protein
LDVRRTFASSGGGRSSEDRLVPGEEDLSAAEELAATLCRVKTV